VVAVNAVVLTIFLWHMSAVLVVVGVLWWAHRLPTSPVGSTAWWLWRVPWLLMLTVVLPVLVAIFAPFETRTPHRGDTPPARLPDWPRRGLRRRVPRLVLTCADLCATAAGLLINNVVSPTHPEPVGVPVAALVLVVAGALVLRLLRAP
jgi:hypothetical protein